MRLALRELFRRPGRFVVAGAILTLIALLLMFLGALLDGLLGSSTGAYRAQEGDLLVYSANARESLVRSRITPAVREQVEGVPGVDAVGGLGSVQLGARPGDQPESRGLVSTVLFGYELAARGLPAEPPSTGEVVADSALRAEGFGTGDALLLGPSRSRVEIVGFVDDTRYAGQASLWGSIDTWRSVLAENRPGQASGETVQALIVDVDGEPASVASAIDSASDDSTESLTLGDATEALPGVTQQRSTFNQIIGVTALVALVVVALFFALITIERLGLYGILKALGASSGSLFLGVVTQAVTVTVAAALVGVAGSMVLDVVIPAGSIPFMVTPGRIVASVILMLVAAVVGSAFSLRRVLKVDPASAIGAST